MSVGRAKSSRARDDSAIFNTPPRYVVMLANVDTPLPDALQEAAKAALALNGQELESGLTLNVFISNPERKKERTDAAADQKEIYVAGLSIFTKQADLHKLFKTVSEVHPLEVLIHEQRPPVRGCQRNSHGDGQRRQVQRLRFCRVRGGGTCRVVAPCDDKLMQLCQAGAAASLNANNHEFKGRRIAVTIADARRSRKRCSRCYIPS
jgi:squamous cell carcinoma antigen recognized by T-cells 3